MAEAMSEERLARLRADNEPIGDHLSGLTADEVGELLDEVERLRAQLAEIGETREEWAVRGGGGTFRMGDEAEARWHAGGQAEPMVVVRRLSGEWREVEQ